MLEGSWNYRILKKEQDREIFFGVYEVFFDAEGRAWSCTEEPVAPMGETLEELKDELLDYLVALRWPVMDFDDIPEEEAISPFDDLDFDNLDTVPWEEVREKLGLNISEDEEE